MSREIDERKKRKALRKLRKAAMLAELGQGPELSDWEKQFLEEFEERIETYGSAFHDLEKGGADEPLSALQSLKLREIDKKARGKGKTGFKSKNSKKPQFKPRIRQLDEDIDEPVPTPISEQASKGLKLVKASDLPVAQETKASQDKPISEPQKRPSGRPVFRVIEGGADKD